MMMSRKETTTELPSGWRQTFWARPGKWYWLGIPVGGFAMFTLGIIFWGGFNAAMSMSSTETFCISCHEMKVNVYAEYRESTHYNNRTGVRATCPDCHVPKPWGAKVLRKFQATLHEIPHWVMGTIDTPEKFEARRLFLATRVWKTMVNNDSRECRNCHELLHMDLELQGRSASRRHSPERALERGETCIDCHQGIAHKLPAGWEDIEFDEFK